MKPFPTEALTNCNKNKPIGLFKTLSDAKKKNITSKNYKAIPFTLPHLKKILKICNSCPLGTKLLKADLVFKVDSDFPDVINELKLRGWRTYDPNTNKFQFLWAKKAKIPKDLKENQIINHLLNINELTTKIGLTENLKGISLNYYPECYIVNDGDIEEFSQKFNNNFIESLLRNLQKSSKSDLEIVNFIYESKYAEKIQKYLDGKVINTLESLEGYLNTIASTDPQYKIRGDQNIWIVKPGSMSRGRGIKIMKSLKSIKPYVSEGSWVIQKYIECPLLISNRKFDIRQWVLVTNNTSLNIYFYKKFYLRFGVEAYSIKNLENLYIHLTNNSITKNSEKFIEEDSMWDSDQFKDWIISQTGQDKMLNITKTMKKIVSTTINLVRSSISWRTKCFELLGYDFMIDSDFKPWLIEINTSPAMDYSTVIFIQPVTEKLVKQMVPQVFNIIFDEKNPSNLEHFLKIQ